MKVYCTSWQKYHDAKFSEKNWKLNWRKLLEQRLQSSIYFNTELPYATNKTKAFQNFGIMKALLHSACESDDRNNKNLLRIPFEVHEDSREFVP